MAFRQVTKNFGSGINEWVKKLRKINPLLGENLFEDPEYKKRNIEKLTEMGLPYFETKIFTIKDFLKDQHKFLSQFRYDQYFVNIIHNNGDREREVEIDGVLVVKDKDNFYLEMIKGKMPDLVSKNNLPDYLAYKNSLEISTKFLIKNKLKYVEINNQKLKSEIWETIKETRFLAGYYEFSLAKIDKNKGELTPFFYEYIDKKEYRL